VTAVNLSQPVAASIFFLSMHPELVSTILYQVFLFLRHPCLILPPVCKMFNLTGIIIMFHIVKLAFSISYHQTGAFQS